jgi:putative intracellular protease/amidase
VSEIVAVAFTFHGLATRDLELPLAALARAGISAELVGSAPGIVHGFDPVRAFEIARRFDRPDRSRAEHVAAGDRPEAATDLVLVPGGFAWRQLADDIAVTGWLRATADEGAYVVGISTGALLVAASGLLGEQRATGHWLALDDLEALGAVVDDEPLVRAGRVFTAAGGLPAVEAIEVIVDELRWSRHE